VRGESLPEAANRRGVDAEDVARALSRHQHREDYSSRLWADRRSDDTDDIDKQPDYSDTRWSDDGEAVEESIEAMSGRNEQLSMTVALFRLAGSMRRRRFGATFRQTQLWRAGNDLQTVRFVVLLL